MPHPRTRYLESSFRSLLSASPLIGLLGHRQVGKTTFLTQHCKSYYTLDSQTENQLATDRPDQYIKQRAGNLVALDECQLVPGLFPALKEWVRVHKRPGQFVMSGSVRFTSREAIRESLTGRIMNLELLPFSLPELMGDPLSNFCIEAVRAQDLSHFPHQRPLQKSKLRKTTSGLQKYIANGGLPGVCLMREPKLRDQKLEEQLLTLLDRDLRLVQNIVTPYLDIRRFTEVLAAQQGTPLEYASLRRLTGLAVPTIKKLIYALEAIFILRTFAIEGTSRKTCVYFEDQGECQYLTKGSLTPLNSLIHFAFTQIRTQFAYRIGENARIFQYRTRGGALVPLCFATREGTLGILPILNPDDVRSVSGSMMSFLSAYSNSKILILHPEVEPYKLLNPRTLLAPIGHVI